MAWQAWNGGMIAENECMITLCIADPDAEMLHDVLCDSLRRLRVGKGDSDAANRLVHVMRKIEARLERNENLKRTPQWSPLDFAGSGG